MPVSTPTHKPAHKSPKKPKPQTTALAAPTIAVVLDESGSMQSVKDATIGSYNEYVQKVQGDEANAGARFALTRFNTEHMVTVGPVPLPDAPLLTGQTYKPNAGTPLYDAIGKTIAEIEAQKPEGPIVVVILTDGEERDSREHTRVSVRSLIEERERGGRWTFVYLGANQNAWQVSASFGIKTGNAMTYDPSAHGTFAVMDAAGIATSGIMRSYNASGGMTMNSSKAFADVGLDKCLACGAKITFDTAHICASK